MRNNSHQKVHKKHLPQKRISNGIKQEASQTLSDGASKNM